jgi:phenylacetate-coenzyme A ligase PaaK-like adenylate-forming protein
VTLLRLLPRFSNAYRALNTLADRETWSRAEIEAWQLHQLNAVWQHARAYVPHYRQIASSRRLPPRFAALQEFRDTVPVLERAQLKDWSPRLLSERPAPGKWHVSSGSTGSPTSFYWEREAHLEVLRCRYRMYAAWGVDLFDRTAFLWSDGARHTPGVAGSLARVRRTIEDRLRNRLRLSAYRLGPSDLRAHLRRLATFRPAALYAYSTSAYLLAREAMAEGIRLASLKLCALSAEPAFPHMVSAVERAFGVPAIVEYGATECPLIAGEGPDRRLRVREDVALVETRPAPDGGHEIVLTLLMNRSFPLLRYAIGDLTDHPLELPESGFAMMKNVAGRRNDLIVTRSGRLLHPTRFDFLFGFTLAKAVRRFQIHQRADGAVTVAVEIGQPVASREIVAVETELLELLEGYPVSLKLVDALPDAPRKHRWTTSDLAPSVSTMVS